MLEEFADGALAGDCRRYLGQETYDKALEVRGCAVVSNLPTPAMRRVLSEPVAPVNTRAHQRCTRPALCFVVVATKDNQKQRERASARSSDRERKSEREKREKERDRRRRVVVVVVVVCVCVCVCVGGGLLGVCFLGGVLGFLKDVLQRQTRAPGHG